MFLTLCIKTHLTTMRFFAGLTGLLFSALAYGDDNPWGFTPPTDPNNIQKQASSSLSSTEKDILLGVGFFLILAAIIAIIAVLMKSSDEKKAEHTNTVVVVIIALLCVTIGGVLVALGWKGASYTQQ